jgi:hypothetical protein
MGSKREHLAALYAAAAGHLEWVDADAATGVAGGLPVALAPYTTNVAGGNRIIRGAEVSFGLGARPIAMTVDDRHRTHASRPVVTTGDAAFDDTYVVQGWPEATLRAALDARAREWIARTWPDGWPSVVAEEGVLRLRLTVFPLGGDRELMGATEFADHVGDLAALARGLLEGHDREREDVVARGGEEAGREWDEGLRRHQASRRRTRAVVRVVVFGVAALVALGVVAAVLAASGLL